MSEEPASEPRDVKHNCGIWTFPTGSYHGYLPSNHSELARSTRSTFQRALGRSHFRSHGSFVHWNQMDLGKGSIGSLLPGTIDALCKATPFNHWKLPVSRWTRGPGVVWPWWMTTTPWIAGCLLWGVTRITRSFAALGGSKTRQEGGFCEIIDQYRKKTSSRITRNVAKCWRMWPYLPSALCICARGRTGGFFISGWRFELHRMYQNVSNVAFYEQKRVADCCSKLNKACCSAKALPRWNLSPECEWICCCSRFASSYCNALAPRKWPPFCSCASRRVFVNPSLLHYLDKASKSSLATYNIHLNPHME